MEKTITLNIEGMTCAGCARKVTKALTSVAGVEAADVGAWQEGTASVRADGAIDPEVLIKAVEEAGYGASLGQVEELLAAEGNGLPEGNQGYDLAIIGGGSAAFAAAIEASDQGDRVAIINEGLPIGGTCVNVGCIPSKTLLRAAEAHYRSTRHSFEGVTSESRVSNFKAIIDQKRELVGALRQEKYLHTIAGDPNIRVIAGRGRLAGEHTVEVAGKSITAANVLIATGASPSVPPIPGLEEAGYLTNETAYELEDLPAHVIVLGAGYIGLENAQLFRRLGSNVTVIEQMDHILPTEQAYLPDALQEYLEEEGITIRTGTAAESVQREGNTVVVDVASEGPAETIEGTHLFLATGRQGNTEDLGLEALGIETRGSGYLKVDETLRAYHSHVFGAGDVIGEPQFVYTAAREGQVAARNALNETDKQPDYSALPWVVFTDPQVAGVGMDEEEARAAGIEMEVAELSLEEVPRAIAARDTRGFIRLIRNCETDQLAGARILAPEGSELLMELVLAIKHGITVEELSSTLHPYLTLSEGVKLAALSFSTDVKKLSCCAG